jgi:hypothetical protein
LPTYPTITYRPSMNSLEWPISRPWREDMRDIGWLVGVGLGAGTLVGYLIVGPLGRLLMFLLRRTSPDAVVGVTSDDGFAIGRVTVATLTLFVVTGLVGALGGLGYACLRTAISGRYLRVGLWTTFCGTLGGATIIHQGGVDFTLLTPTPLAIGGFIALPAIGGLATAMLIERWSPIRPTRDRRTVAIPAIGVLALPVAAVAAAVAGLWFAGTRHSGGQTLAVVARFALPILVGVVIVVATIDFVRDIVALA